MIYLSKKLKIIIIFIIVILLFIFYHNLNNYDNIKSRTISKTFPTIKLDKQEKNNTIPDKKIEILKKYLNNPNFNQIDVSEKKAKFIIN